MDEVFLHQLYIICQVLYLFSFLVIFYFITRKVNWVDSSRISEINPEHMPRIVLLYPVLHEDEDTMHTTMVSLGQMDYPGDKYNVIAVPNSDDRATIASLRHLQEEFPFLQVLEIPPTDDPSWDVVWKAWETNPKAYWWHQGKFKSDKNLPPKKTRQLVYAFYTLVEQDGTDWVLDYVDADSITPANHFKLAAIGLQEYDVLQSTNVVGNLLDTPATSLHANDHMSWDGLIYPHMSANGEHPYYVLGKGLFFKASDLVDLGGFDPWITIEDPEVGMRFWVNNKRLGIIAEPLIEEVPQDFVGGIIQRNRWMCGFYQSLSNPLKQMGMSFWQRQLARINLVPALSLLINVIGLPTGVYGVYRFIQGTGPFAPWVVVLSLTNIACYVILMSLIYTSTWKRTKLVLNNTSSRIWYMVRINPLVLFFYWLLWAVPITIGFGMFLTDRGRAWKRTEKVDADRHFVSR